MLLLKDPVALLHVSVCEPGMIVNVHAMRWAEGVPSSTSDVCLRFTNNLLVLLRRVPGAFGEVYKGILWGQEVAVKKMLPGKVLLHNQFKKEVEIMRCVLVLPGSFGVFIVWGATIAVALSPLLPLTGVFAVQNVWDFACYISRACSFSHLPVLIAYTSVLQRLRALFLTHCAFLSSRPKHECGSRFIASCRHGMLFNSRDSMTSMLDRSFNWCLFCSVAT